MRVSPMRILLNSKNEFIVITEDNNVCSLVGGKPDHARAMTFPSAPDSEPNPSNSLLAACVAITGSLRKVFPPKRDTLF